MAEPSTEKPAVQSLIHTLKMQSHIEGGYFVETDRDPALVPNPFHPSTDAIYRSTQARLAALNPTVALYMSTVFPSDNDNDTTRNASTTIFYLVTEKSPMGAFHRNKARTVHTLHRGRGRYVLIHADEAELSGGKARIETFVVGQNVEKGERLQWIVEGGKYKCSYLLPDEEGGDSSNGLLISETVVPGFDYKDHDFCPMERFRQLVTEEQAKEMEWMIRKT
ncbi:cupin domain-containing protein [Rhizodiscina lignyota]|uniref:Cupin domain-containing protein n=1 Tax=Rhizodiscina lignyota TaxID=1504668 RepID=A0A9P4IFA8_9PEZI|nr:cupin domain-containing protein [Rhizodiscina lignyota]